MFLVDPAAMEDFKGVETEQPNCVMVGLAPSSFTYDKLTAAFRWLKLGCTIVGVAAVGGMCL